MTTPVTREDLMRYIDGELSPEDRRRVESATESSTELRRELELFRSVTEDLQGLQFAPQVLRESTWDHVNQRLARPVGWLFVLAGDIIWLVFGAYQFLTSAGDFWPKLASGGIVIGMLILLSTVIWERAREWETDPYRHIER